MIGRINGKQYTFIKELSDGSSMYAEKEMHDAARIAWCKGHGRKAAYKVKGKRKVNEVPEPMPLVEEKKIEGCSEPLDNDMLNSIYTSFLRKLTLYDRHSVHLHQDGWSNDLIHRSFIRSIPFCKNQKYLNTKRVEITDALIQEFGSVRGVPGFFKQTDGTWSFAARTSGMFIPIYDYKGRIYRLRIRLDYPERDENGKEKNKYNNFSSLYEKKSKEGVLYNSFQEGCSAGNHIGFYCKPDDDFTVCYITEGEKKALRANDELHCPVISIPGVNSFRKILEPLEDGMHALDYLKAMGCKIVIIAYDADKTINEAVLFYEGRLIHLVHEYGLQVAVANWNLGFGKGFDDILKVGVRPNYSLAVI